MKTSDLNPNEYSAYFANYIKKIEDIDLLEALHISLNDSYAFFKSIPEEKLSFKYEEGKWTIKEILLHIIDTERIFSYRALRFARHDKNKLPGFEHTDYVDNSNANERSMDSLLSEYLAVRNASIIQFLNFNEQMLLKKGNASNADVSVRALGFLIIGHEKHHIDIINERYL